MRRRSQSASERRREEESQEDDRETLTVQLTEEESNEVSHIEAEMLGNDTGQKESETKSHNSHKRRVRDGKGAAISAH